MIHLAVRLPGSTDYPSLVQMVRTAERGLLDFVLLTGPASVTALSALAAQSTRVGLIATVDAADAQPFEVARQLATLDHLSEGRSGWSVTLAPRATELVTVARAFWDSWEPDAVRPDERTGRYVDPSRVHPVDFRGEQLEVRGYATVPAGPQGHPVLFVDDDTSDGWDFAAAHADVVVTSNPVGVTARAAAHGRGPDQFRVFAAATELDELLQSGACDGFLLAPEDLDDVVDSVVPRLQDRGRYRTAYDGATLRTHLGIG